MDWQLGPLFLAAESGLGPAPGLWHHLNGLLNWAGLETEREDTQSRPSILKEVRTAGLLSFNHPLPQYLSISALEKYHYCHCNTQECAAQQDTICSSVEPYLLQLYV